MAQTAISMVVDGSCTPPLGSKLYIGCIEHLCSKCLIDFLQTLIRIQIHSALSLVTDRLQLISLQLRRHLMPCSCCRVSSIRRVADVDATLIGLLLLVEYLLVSRPLAEAEWLVV